MTRAITPRRHGRQRLEIVLPPSIVAWLGYLSSQRQSSAETVIAYSSDMRQLCAFCLSRYRSCEPATMTLARLEAWIASMEATHAPASRARKLNALKSLFGWLSARGIVPSNPTFLMARPRRARLLPRVLSREEVSRVLAVPSSDSLEDVRLRALLELLYSSGMRVSELSTLRLNALAPGAVRVFGKGKRERLCFLTRPAQRAMTDWLAQRAAWLKAHECRDSGHVWISFLDGAPLGRKSVWGLVSRAGKRAGLAQRVYPHMFRHSFATHILAGGANLREVQEMMGHESAETTARYAHVDEGQLRDVHRRAHPRA